MNLRPFILPVALMAACTAGPESPMRYSPVTTLSFNFKDVPPGEDIASAFLELSLVNYLPGLEAPSSECSESAGFATLDSFIPEGAQFRLPPIRTRSVSNWSEACAQRYPEALNFLKVYAGVFGAPDIGGMGVGGGTWTPGAFDLVYAHSPSTFMPFGPAGAAVTIPEGYSWLRRTCGPAGNTELSVVPISETLDLYPGKSIMPHAPGTGPTTAEFIEQDLATACGSQPAPRDLGTRVSFDRAKDLLWSADGTSLFYLAPDAQDPNGAVGIRQVKLLEHTTSDIAVVNHASALQTGATGVLYVTADGITYALPLSAGYPAALQPMPFSGGAQLSPDGLWFAYDGDGRVHLWSVPVSAEVVAMPGGVIAWSPDSRLLYGPTPFSLPSSSGPTPYELSVASPASPDQVVSCGGLSQVLKTQGHLAWESECPQLAYAPQSWSIESAIARPDCEHCFGVSLQDPATGSERSVLDPAAGLVHLVDTHPIAGYVFAWARTCQGLYNTVCTFSLLRIRLADGTAETVVTADQELPVALSWDNRRLALSAANGIYVKELPQ